MNKLLIVKKGLKLFQKHYKIFIDIYFYLILKLLSIFIYYKHWSVLKWNLILIPDMKVMLI